MRYYKITNREERHNGMKYKTGLNTDILPFNPSGDCEPGGIYFASEDILAFVFDYAGSDLSGWIREVTIPDGEQVYENPGEPKKYKAHAVILGKRRKITGKVVAELCAEGANVHAGDDAALCYAAYNGHAAVVEALIAAGANVHARDDAALRWAACNGHAAVVEALIAAGANVHAVDDAALCCAASDGHAQIVEALIAAGADPVAAASVSWISGELKTKLLRMVRK